jgi:redox-sensing transcriptional repressor
MSNATREVVRRLSSYRKVLLKLKGLGFKKVFSDNLGDALGVSASQVRKDFSLFQLSGNKKGGYTVDDLIDKLNEILGKSQVQKIIVVGCGKLGTALMWHNGFIREGIKVVAGFDTDPTVINENSQVPVYDMGKLKDFVKKENIKIAIMTVPESAAMHVFDALVESKIHGVLNFTPAPLKATESCAIHSVNLSLEIENLFFFANY